MWTKEKVDKFIYDYGFTAKETKREIKELPNILHAGEELCGLLEGQNSFGMEGGTTGGSNGLIIATNKRIIFFHKSRLFGVVSMQEMPLCMIVSCMYTNGVMYSTIVFSTANTHITADWCVQEAAKRFHKTVNELLTGQHISVQNNTQNKQALSSNLEQLEKLFELKQREIITEEEFKQQKSRLLSTESSNDSQYQQAQPKNNENEYSVQFPEKSGLSSHSKHGQKGGNKGCLKFILITFSIIILIGILTSKEEKQTNTLNNNTESYTTKKEKTNTLTNDTKIDTTVIQEKKWILKIDNGKWIIDSINNDYSKQNQSVNEKLTQKVDSMTTDTILSILSRFKFDLNWDNYDDDDTVQKHEKNIPFWKRATGVRR